MMVVDTKYEIGQELYVKTDPDQYKRIVTGIIIRPGNISYELSLGPNTSWHYDFEISEEVDVMMITNN